LHSGVLEKVIWHEQASYGLLAQPLLLAWWDVRMPLRHRNRRKDLRDPLDRHLVARQ